jgi:hypothetical protein
LCGTEVPELVDGNAGGAEGEACEGRSLQGLEELGVGEPEGDVGLILFAGVRGDEVFDPLDCLGVDLFCGGSDEGGCGSSGDGVGLDSGDDLVLELLQLRRALDVIEEEAGGTRCSWLR